MTTRFIFTDEPAPYGTRFRYVSEGTCHGPILGQSSIQGNRTHPNVACYGNFPDGQEAILLVSLVSDVTRDPSGIGIHGHTFFGKNVFNGQYIVHLKASNSQFTHQLQGVTVIHTKSSDKNDILSGKYIQDRILQREGIYNYSILMQKFNSTTTTKQLNLEWFRSNYQEFLSESKIVASNVQYLANQVRLKFDLFIMNIYTRNYSNPPETIISQVVHNTRDKEHKPLQINRSSRTSGSPLGGEEIFLFCDEFIPKDLEVVFFVEKLPDQRIGNGEFSASDIHNKCGIAFTTPRLLININNPLRTNYCLKRGDMQSNWFDFVYIPDFPYHPEPELKFQPLTSFDWRSDVPNLPFHDMLPNVLPNSLSNQYPHPSIIADPQEILPMESGIMGCHPGLDYLDDAHIPRYIPGSEPLPPPIPNTLFSNTDPSSASPQYYPMYQNPPNNNYSS